MTANVFNFAFSTANDRRSRKLDQEARSLRESRRRPGGTLLCTRTSYHRKLLTTKPELFVRENVCFSLVNFKCQSKLTCLNKDQFILFYQVGRYSVQYKEIQCPTSLWMRM